MLMFESGSGERGKFMPDGSYEFTARGQLFGPINDQLYRFLPGSYSKTIKEKVAKGRVPIKDGHPGSAASKVVGRILEGWADSSAFFYRGKLSKVESDIAQKIHDGTVSENSAEGFPISATIERVDLEKVPQVAQFFAYSRDGKVDVEVVSEFALHGMGLVAESSQGIDAIVRLGSALEASSGLPLAASDWNAEEAGRRILAWASPFAGSPPNQSRLERAYVYRCYSAAGDLVLLGQVADVEDGRLVIVPDAYDSAFEEIRAAEVDEADRAAAFAALWKHSRATDARRESVSLASSGGHGVRSEDAEGLAGPAATPPTNDGSGEEADEAVRKLQTEVLRLKLSQAELEGTVQRRLAHEPASTSGAHS